jgi:hypothetical protein
MGFFSLFNSFPHGPRGYARQAKPYSQSAESAAQAVNFFTSIKYCFALLIENDLQKPASPLQGFLSLRSNPGLRPLCGLRPGLCNAALSALGVGLLSLTHMSPGAGRWYCQVAEQF